LIFSTNQILKKACKSNENSWAYTGRISRNWTQDFPGVRDNPNHWNISQISMLSRTSLTRGVSHYGLAIFIKKYLKAKEELWKIKHFTMQKFNLKKLSKRNQNPSRYYNSGTNLKFQHKLKYHLKINLSHILNPNLTK
jgi:hypothetical protein